MKIVIVAGGTGGHVYPALSLADELKKRKNDILFIGSTTRMEKDLIPSKGYKYIGLDVSIPNGNIANKAVSFGSIVGAYFKCLKILKGYDLAIGFGNYISIPVMLAAKKLKMKTIIHEQNSFAGKANKFLDEKMDLVIGSYKENKDVFKNPNTQIIGNPQSSKAYNVAKDPNVIKDFGLDPNKKTVLIFMGSLGSQTVNKVILNYFKLLDGSYQVIYATGKQNYEVAKNSVKKKPYLVLREAVDGVSVMKNCDLLVCRAGATTLAEVIASGTPSILIPSPYVPNNHQYFNAMSLVKQNAARIIEEKDLSAKVLNDEINNLINDDKTLKELSKNAKLMANPNVMEDILEAIEKL